MSKKASVRKTEPSAGNPQLERFEELMKLMGKHGIAELEFENQSERIALRTKESFAMPVGVAAPMAVAASPAAPAPAARPSAPSPAPSAPAHEPRAAAPAASSKGKQVLSPFVGTFYRAPAPGKEPYIKIGQSVKQGQVMCIIEAMKLMNEIEAEFSGKVVEILVEDGQPVEFGEPLFAVEPA